MSEASHSDSAPGPAEELAYRLRQQELLSEFGAFAIKTFGMEALLQEATRVCALGMQCELCKVLEYQPPEGDFIVRAGVGWQPGVVGRARLKADSESPAGYAFKTGQPVMTNDLSQERRFRTPELLTRHGVKGAINVLIESDAQRYGVLEVDSTKVGRFRWADLRFLQGFANLLGVAIARRREEDARKSNENLLKHALQEIDHRVKNSLSIVAGLLSLQRAASADEEVKRALADAESRVRTVARVHERLSLKSDARDVNLAEFMNELCEGLKANGGGHVLTCDVEAVTVPADKAVTLGLLANELLTNCFKYAYPGDSGEVKLSIARAGGKSLTLSVSDRGVGLPAHMDAAHSKRLGMKLIAALSDQLAGRASWRRADPGVEFTLEFPAQ